VRTRISKSGSTDGAGIANPLVMAMVVDVDDVTLTAFGDVVEVTVQTA
jgi:hypothetical protein